jgi:maleylacetate reductase
VSDIAWTHTSSAQQVLFGAGRRAELPALLKSLGVQRAMLVTTAGRLESDDGQQLVRSLDARLGSTFGEVESHVPTNLVQAAHLQARRDGVDAIVSFGGGSCADLGKAVCFFVEQEAGTPGASFADRPGLVHVAVPTTYSGAELTPFFGMTDPATRQKSGAGGPTIAPTAVVYDVELGRSTPASVRAGTGLNALAHCVEIAWSPYRTPEAEAIGLFGAGRIFDALPAAVADLDDDDAATAMLEGACLAGRCLSNGSMGVHHGLAQVLGGRTGLPHGTSNALLLEHSIRFNAEAVPDEVRRIGAAIGAPDDPAGAIAELVAGLEGLPPGLAAAGVTEEDIDVVARLSQGNGSVQANPRPVSEDDARDILTAAL